MAQTAGGGGCHMTSARTSRVSGATHPAITIFFLSFPVHAKHSGGTGEPHDLCQITTGEDLMLMGDSPDDYEKYSRLVADADLSDFDGMEGRPRFSIIGKRLSL